MSVSVGMPSISYVVARSERGHVIGCENKLPWHLRTDLKNFKKITTNHVVLMGRKTFDSIGKPLPNRINIVMSSKATDGFPNVYFSDNRDSALYLADFFSVINGYQDIFVIGGGTIYEEFKQTFNKVYLTEVYAEEMKGDAFFDYKFDPKEWLLQKEEKFPASEIDEYPFALKVFKKRDLTARKRSRLLSTFLTPDQNLKDWELKQLEKIKLPKEKLHANWLKMIQFELPEIQKIVAR